MLLMIITFLFNVLQTVNFSDRVFLSTSKTLWLMFLLPNKWHCLIVPDQDNACPIVKQHRKDVAQIQKCEFPLQTHSL